MLTCEPHVQQEATSTIQSLYQSLLEYPDTQNSREQARSFIAGQLSQARGLQCDLPDDMTNLSQWSDAHVIEVGKAYQAYLNKRKAGGPREYFHTRSHALFYLQAIAPTKFVDGAWLYGLTWLWRDDRFYPLIKTYIEELGEGNAQQNHVLLYRKLLQRHGCFNDINKSDSLYLQGAIQLALGHNSEAFLPEILGYNLGYEQPPLHMLITAYELKELGIDPYYFTLHVTTDNASTGHARQAVDVVQRLAPAVGSTDAFYDRVKAGYRLNQLGLNYKGLLASFDLEQQTVKMLEQKRFYGANMHSDFCRIEGKTVNEWLQIPGQIKAFLNAMVKCRWVKRNEDPQRSRFWQLIAGDNAKMAGVFSPYEAQLIYDWIAGDWLASRAGQHASNKVARLVQPAPPSANCAAPSNNPVENNEGDVDSDVQCVERELAGLPTDDKMRRLIELMAPDKHTTAAGLLATRMFWKYLCR
ncbi:MAG: iron-containing redox enzyme family protein [Idiomarina sp.]|nr:iron-containing redox enzyme family protein [Idiomarina sp.]